MDFVLTADLVKKYDAFKLYAHKVMSQGKKYGIDLKPILAKVAQEFQHSPNKINYRNLEYKIFDNVEEFMHAQHWWMWTCIEGQMKNHHDFSWDVSLPQISAFYAEKNDLAIIKVLHYLPDAEKLEPIKKFWYEFFNT